MKDWLGKKIDKYSELSGYVKPDIHGGALKLDSNENFAIPKQLQADLLNAARKNSDVREYPLGKIDKLAKSLSAHLKIPPYMIGIGNGSDQILDLIIANFASKKKVLTSNPTFGFFEERCKLYCVPTIKIPFSKQMTLDASEFIKRSKDADILYLDSPNNPTGFQFSKNNLEKITKNFDGLIIIDEAYGEFANYSAVPWTKKLDNLIVIRTFSKSFGLAGLRLGYFIANKKFTEMFNRVIQYPYPVSTISIETGISALQKYPQVRESIQTIKKERSRIIKNLQSYDAFEVFDSEANFVLFDAKGADKRIHTALIEQGISIRRIGRIGKHAGCLRVTVGTKEMNSKFLLAIRDLLG